MRTPVDDLARHDTLRELILLRNEYSLLLLNDLDLEDRKRTSRMIAELSACIERLEHDLAS